MAEILTVGHSTRPIDAFLALLAAHTVTRLVDVRTVPRSGHNPQFNQDILSAALAGAGIDYRHEPGLGGFRKTHPGSPNGAWRNLSFRGYADYMQTAEFQGHLARVVEDAARFRQALMCAEAVPWRCHRSLIADALVARGVPAFEIVSSTRLQAHKLTAFARVDGGVLTYPPEQTTLPC